MKKRFTLYVHYVGMRSDLYGLKDEGFLEVEAVNADAIRLNTVLLTIERRIYIPLDDSWTLELKFPGDDNMKLLEVEGWQKC